MATTCIRPYKTAKGLTALETVKDRFDYGLNLKKCAAVCSYLCDPDTAHAEFLLVKHQYEAITGRPFERGMWEILQGERLPKMDALKAEWQTLAAAKKSGYAEYRAAQKDMREAVAVKANIDHLLGITAQEKNKEMER